MTDFSVRVERNGDVTRLILAGELDLACARELETALVGAEEGRPSRLVLDLRDLRFMDSTGLRLFLSADDRARREERRLTIVRGPDPVDRVFRIARLDTRLELIDDPAAIGSEEAQA